MHEQPVTRVTYQALLGAGLTPRQVDHWSRTGLLRTTRPTPGYGYHRVWLDGELEIAQTMGALVSAGVRPADAERAARNGGWLSDRVRVVITDRAGAVAA